jgi:hypothetical protein
MWGPMVALCLYAWKINPFFVKKGAGAIFAEQGLVCTPAKMFWSLPFLGGNFIIAIPIFGCVGWTWYIHADLAMFMFLPWMFNSFNSYSERKNFCLVFVVLSNVFSTVITSMTQSAFNRDAFMALLYFSGIYRAKIYFLGCYIGVITHERKKNKELKD